MQSLDALAGHLKSLRLSPLGHCHVDNDHGLTGTLVLVGPDEPGFWSYFKESPEFGDGGANPLDRWSFRVLSDVAKEMGAKAVFPFGGPPYLPFYTWALQTGRFWSSPIGFLVHDTAGLFVSFRGAIVLSGHLPLSPGTNPCDTCTHQPCKSACPVGAFDNGYDVSACKTHIAAPEGHDCMARGCHARRACPVGQGNRLPEQAAFHMKAFL